MSVEFEEVVGGGDQVDLGLDGGFAASEDAGDPADVFDVGEHRLDDLLSAPVGRLAFVGLQSGGQRLDVLVGTVKAWCPDQWCD